MRGDGYVVVCAIESSMTQLVGAAMQASIAVQVENVERYVLTVVGERMGTRDAVAAIARGLGIATVTADRLPGNPFLNKFVALPAVGGALDDQRVALLDWDIIPTTTVSLPMTPDDAIGARRNPADLYQDSADDYAGRVESSVNGGVLLGRLHRMLHLKQRVFERMARDERVLRQGSEWSQEQLAISLALQGMTLHGLHDRWNATPLSNVSGEEVRLWHYNDSTEWTRTLKRNLLCPSVVHCLIERHLSPAEPVRQVFLRIYNEVTERPLVRAFLRDQRKVHALAM